MSTAQVTAEQRIQRVLGGLTQNALLVEKEAQSLASTMNEHLQVGASTKEEVSDVVEEFPEVFVRPRGYGWAGGDRRLVGYPNSLRSVRGSIAEK